MVQMQNDDLDCLKGLFERYQVRLYNFFIGHSLYMTYLLVIYLNSHRQVWQKRTEKRRHKPSGEALLIDKPEKGPAGPFLV